MAILTIKLDDTLPKDILGSARANNELDSTLRQNILASSRGSYTIDGKQLLEFVTGKKDEHLTSTATGTSLACCCPQCLQSENLAFTAASTGDYRIDAVIHPSERWNATTLTFSFAANISAGIRNNVRAIFDILGRSINLDFLERTTGTGNIHYSFDNTDNPYAYARRPSDGGDVFLNQSFDNANDTNGFQGGVGTHGFMSLIHETLHALGLKHPGNYNGSDLGDAPFLWYGEDNTTNTVMSYNFAGRSASTPMPYDLLALQYLYGARTYNESNTNYVFDSVFGFNDGNRYWGSATAGTKVSIWDSGGIDTLDFSRLGFNSLGYRFDLNQGGMLSTKSAFNGTSYKAKDNSLPGDRTTESYQTTTFGTAIAYGATIENAIGTSSNDEIIGNGVNNILQGGSGNDTLDGRAGDDALYGGAGNDVLMSRETFNGVVIGLAGNFTEMAGGWTSFDKYPRQVADVNGDGRADIVGFGDNFVFTSLGQVDGTFSGLIVASNDFNVNGGGWTSFNQYPRQVADVNGDGRADIVGFGNDFVFTSLGQADGTFSGLIVAHENFSVGDTWVSFDRYPRQVADVNGDGRADIVGFASDAVYVSLGQTNGTFGQAFVANTSYTESDTWVSFDLFSTAIP
jgi:hypothetical protein